MKHIQIYILLLLLVVGSSCKKKDYPKSTAGNDVVFYFKGEVNKNPVLIEAGNNDYYMYSSFEKASQALYNLRGDLKKSSCSNCAYGIQVEISDFKMRAFNETIGSDIDSLLRSGKRNILADGSEPYSAAFLSYFNKNAVSYLWNFGDGATSTSKDANHVYKKSGKYDVCLSIKDGNGCYSIICGEQKIGLKNVCTTRINAVAAPSFNTIQFGQVSAGVGAIRYLWDFGDGSPKNTQASPVHTYKNSGSYPITLRATDDNGDVAIAHYNVLTSNDMSSCAANYTLASATQTVFAPSLSLSSVVIKWVDTDGSVYTSNNTLQPAASYFEIISAENYEDNENGKKTKKVLVRFSATVYNGSRSLLLENAEAVIALAYE